MDLSLARPTIALNSDIPLQHNSILTFTYGDAVRQALANSKSRTFISKREYVRQGESSWLAEGFGVLSAVSQWRGDSHIVWIATSISVKYKKRVASGASPTT